MPLDLPIIPISQTFAPNIRAPKDLSGLIDAFQHDYNSSFMDARNQTDESIIGNSRANKEAMQNRAATEKATQDATDQTGRRGKAPTDRSNFDWSLFTDQELQDILNFSK